VCIRCSACLWCLRRLSSCCRKEVPAHDPETWGGVFRTHDAGATWTSINRGIFVSGALALAVSSRDPNHLLLATDSGVWRSRNGGRDWDVEAPGHLDGPGIRRRIRCWVASARWWPPGFDPLPRRWRPLAAGPYARGRRPGTLAGSRSGAWTRISGRADPGSTGATTGGGPGRTQGRTLEADHIDALLAPPGRPDDIYAVSRGIGLVEQRWRAELAAAGWRSSRQRLRGLSVLIQRPRTVSGR
jgi:hypothetical protein